MYSLGLHFVRVSIIVQLPWEIETFHRLYPTNVNLIETNKYEIAGKLRIVRDFEIVSLNCFTAWMENSISFKEENCFHR